MEFGQIGGGITGTHRANKVWLSLKKIGVITL